MKYSAQSLAKQFCQGIYVSVADRVLWQQAFTYMNQQQDVTIFEKNRIAQLWAAHGGELRNRVKDDQLVLNVLRKALPAYRGEGITVYRGECWGLFDEGQLGFCWTASEAVASRYAQGLNAVESGGVLLKGYAPASAILAKVSGSGDGQEVYICDPEKLLRLSTLALYPKP